MRLFSNAGCFTTALDLPSRAVATDSVMHVRPCNHRDCGNDSCCVQPNEGVIVMAATNAPETLDAALTRPGRFDRNVVVRHPAQDTILPVTL